MFCNPWDDIMKMPDADFEKLRRIATSNAFIMVASGADRGNRYTYHVARELRRCGVELPQDQLTAKTRLVTQAITTRICQTANKLA